MIIHLVRADLPVVIDPSSPHWSVVAHGELTLQRLDYDNIRIINSCLAQTVNLQYFEAQVRAGRRCRPLAYS